MAQPGKPVYVTGRGPSDAFPSGVHARVYFKFTPSRTRIDNMYHMRDKMLVNLARNARETTARLEEAIKGRVSWEDHPDRHPSTYYPSGGTAYENIFASLEISGELFSISAGHGADTVHESSGGEEYTYGGILESGEVGQRHRVIKNTWDGADGEEAFKETFLTMMTGGLLVGYTVTNGD